MVFLVRLLTNHCVHNGLEDVLLRKHTFHILDQLVRLINVVVFEVVNDEVKSGFRNDIYERGQDLESVFASTENNQVMS